MSSDKYPLSEYISDGVKRDETFKNNMEILFGVLLPLRDLVEAINDNDVEKYNTSRKLLLPLLGAFGCSTDGPRTIVELFQYYERLPDEICEQYRTFFTFRGKAYDELQEEFNRAIKSSLPSVSVTERTFLKAMCMANGMIKCRSALFDVAGIDGSGLKSRTHFDQSDLIHSMADLLTKTECFDIQNRSYCANWEGGVVDAKDTVVSLFHEGQKVVDNWTAQFLRKKLSPWPSSLVDMKKYSHTSIGVVAGPEVVAMDT